MRLFTQPQPSITSLLFSFFKSPTTTFSLETDIHAHLLPGIDDGPKTMDESIEMIEFMVEMGYKKLVATPHIYWEYYPNTSNTIFARLAELREAVAKKNIAVKLTTAAEYYLDDHFEELLNKGELLTIYKNFVLIECSLLSPTANLANYLFQLQIKGYRPILAHPERYLYLKETDYTHLVEQGCKFQINLLSLAGHYGKEIQKRAFFLLKNYNIDYLGTDAHHLRHLNLLKTFLNAPKTQKMFKYQTFTNNLI